MMTFIRSGASDCDDLFLQRADVEDRERRVDLAESPARTAPASAAASVAARTCSVACGV